MPAHLSAVTQSARARAAKGDLRGAAALLTEAIDAATTQVSRDHPEVLTATRYLASLHRETGEPTTARRLLEEALAAGSFILGEAHPLMLSLSYDLAVIADELANLHEARRNYARVQRYGPAVLGPEHEYVRAAQGYLAGAGSAGGGERGEPAAPAAPPAPPPSVPPTPPSAPPMPPAAPPMPASAPPPDPPAPVVPARTGWPRAPLTAIALVVTAALMGGAIAAIVAFNTTRHEASPAAHRAPSTSPSPAATGYPAPTNVRIRDDRTAITLTWSDPSGGKVRFLIAGGRADRGPSPLQSLRPGETTYTLSGLSPSVDYCFLVAAVYSAEHTVPSSLVCTQRAATRSASPSR